MKIYTTEELASMQEAFLKRFPSPPRVMVCIPTYAQSAAKAPLVFAALAQQIYPNFEVVFLDTTPVSGGHYAELLDLAHKHLSNVRVTIMLTTTPPGSDARRIVTEAREQLRRHFLESDAPYLFFLDDDVILPPDAIATLYAHQQPAMVGVYLNPMVLREGHAPEIAPCIWVDVPETGKHGSETLVRPVQVLEVMPGRVMKVGISGFGCSLFTRGVMAGSAFDYNPVSTASEDTPFFIDLERRGIPAFCDTRVKCWHLKFPYGDDRNARLDFDKYRLQFVP